MACYNYFREKFTKRSRDVFSHSAQCDEFFSKICDLPGGQPHPFCGCWCHAAEFDKNEPPEYLMETLENEAEQIAARVVIGYQTAMESSAGYWNRVHNAKQGQANRVARFMGLVFFIAVPILSVNSATKHRRGRLAVRCI